MPVIVGASRLHVWRIGITGLAGTITVDLNRYPDNFSTVDASETVTVAEIGTTGEYALTYTPTLAQKYVGDCTESTFGQTFQFVDDPISAPSPATVDDSYCSIADVVAFAQIGIPTNATTPTEAEVLGFMAKRAGMIYGTMARVLAANTPGPSNYAVTFDLGTDTGKALSQACRFVNAIGAAMDMLEAAGANQAPAQTERVKELATAYTGALAELVTATEGAAAVLALFAATHISSGEITQPSVTARQQTGIQFTGNTRF